MQKMWLVPTISWLSMQCCRSPARLNPLKKWINVKHVMCSLAASAARPNCWNTPASPCSSPPSDWKRNGKIATSLECFSVCCSQKPSNPSNLQPAWSMRRLHLACISAASAVPLPGNKGPLNRTTGRNALDGNHPWARRFRACSRSSSSTRSTSSSEAGKKQSKYVSLQAVDVVIWARSRALQKYFLPHAEHSSPKTKYLIFVRYWCLCLAWTARAFLEAKPSPQRVHFQLPSPVIFMASGSCTYLETLFRTLCVHSLPWAWAELYRRHELRAALTLPVHFWSIAINWSSWLESSRWGNVDRGRCFRSQAYDLSKWCNQEWSCWFSCKKVQMADGADCIALLTYRSLLACRRSCGALRSTMAHNSAVVKWNADTGYMSVWARDATWDLIPFSHCVTSFSVILAHVWTLYVRRETTKAANTALFGFHMDISLAIELSAQLTKCFSCLSNPMSEVFLDYCMVLDIRP